MGFVFGENRLWICIGVLSDKQKECMLNNSDRFQSKRIILLGLEKRRVVGVNRCVFDRKMAEA